MKNLQGIEVKLRLGDLIQDIKESDIWEIVDIRYIREGEFKAKCVDPAGSCHLSGEITLYSEKYSHWRVVTNKSGNFKNLYDKLSAG